METSLVAHAWRNWVNIGEIVQLFSTDTLYLADIILLTKDIAIKEEERFRNKPIVRVRAADAGKKASQIIEQIAEKRQAWAFGQANIVNGKLQLALPDTISIGKNSESVMNRVAPQDG